MIVLVYVKKEKSRDTLLRRVSELRQLAKIGSSINLIARSGIASRARDIQIFAFLHIKYY